MHDTRSVFESKGLRCTRRRIELYETLAACRCHPTAEQLHRLVAARSPGTSLATVYNTLEAFTHAGLCRKFTTSGGGARFDADITNHLHVVTDDGRLIDVPHDLGESILAGIKSEAVARLEKEMGVTIGHVEVHLRAV